MLVRDLVHERTGIYFDNQSLPLMADKLAERLAGNPSKTCLDYYYALKAEPDGAREWREVMNLFSVQETYFWREIDQINYLVEKIVPDWFAQTTDPLTIWSAACASGEEPYSIAMALDAAGWGEYPISIQASDASEKALERAGQALYRERAFRLFPHALRRRYFEEQSKAWKLRPAIADRVTFRRINLMTEPDLGQISNPQVVFCRNVFIYFSPTSISRVVNLLAKRMPPGASLFLGATESLLKLTDQFELFDMGNCFVYRHTPRQL